MRIGRLRFAGIAFCILFGGAVVAHCQGLSVRRDGVLIHDGKPFRGIGVDYFDAFYRTVTNGKATSYEAGFKELRKRQIPFCRILCGGFWPSEQALYTQNRGEFFARLDAVVRSAERNRVGLILSMFWTPSTVPDLVGEPVSNWGNLNSKTIDYMRRYVRDVATRYRKSRAIWGWEFGNEYALGADLPNARDNRPPVVPTLGTPNSRSANDEWRYSDLHVAYLAFAKEIRRYDRTRMIESGDSVLRESAWHNRSERSWKLDTAEQQESLMAEINPDPIDVISIHTYGNDGNRISAYQAWGKKVHKPLFVGEFGAETKDSNAKATFEKLLHAIEQMEQPFAALWVYDFSGQADSWTVTADGPRSWQLDEIQAANLRLGIGH